MITFEEAKNAVAYVKQAHPEQFEQMGGKLITDEKIQEAVIIVDAISGAINMSDDALFKKELTRLCNVVT